MSRTKWRQRTRAVAAAATAGLALAALVGCSQTPKQVGSATSGSITWWGWTPQVEVGQQYIKAFNEEYPNIKVTYKQVATADYDAAIKPALASSVGPDVFNMAPGGGIGSVGLYGGSAVDLGPVAVDKIGADWKQRISPIGLKGLTVDGKVDAFSVGSTYAGSVWINPQLFAKAGLTPPKTFSEWVDDCAAFKTKGITCFEQGAGDNGFNQDMVHAIADSIHPGLWSRAVAGKAKWTSPDLVKAMTTFKSMFNNGIFQKGALGAQQYPDVNNDFLAGRTAMVMMGTWYMQYSTQDGAKAAVAASGASNAQVFPIIPIPFPQMTGGSTTTPLFGDADYGVGVNVKSKNQKAAETFATWLGTSTKAQQVVANALNDISSLKSVSPDWSSITLVDDSTQQPALKSLIASTASITEPRLGDVDTQLGQAIGDALQAVATGRQSPQQALGQLQNASGQ